MNLFRSEEHVRSWSGFKEGTEAGILSLEDLMAIFSTALHTEKLSRHYVSSITTYKSLFVEEIRKLKGDMAFWVPPSP